MWAIPAALIRGLWAPVYAASSLTLTPALPLNITTLVQHFPLVWGGYLIFIDTVGSGPIVGATVDGAPLPASQWTAVNVTLLWDTLPPAPANLTLHIVFGSGSNQLETQAGNVVSAHRASRRRDISRGISHETSVRVLRSLAVLPETPILWLDATTLNGTQSGSAVSVWPDISGNFANATQAVSSLCPLYNSTGGGGPGLPSVAFDGAQTYLSGNLTLGSQSTIVAVVSNAPSIPQTDCCSGVFFSEGGCNGLGMKYAPQVSDDSITSNATVLMIDWSGSPDSGVDDLTGRQVRGAS